MTISATGITLQVDTLSTLKLLLKPVKLLVLLSVTTDNKGGTVHTERDGGSGISHGTKDAGAIIDIMMMKKCNVFSFLSIIYIPRDII